MLASVDLFPNPREWNLGLPWHLGNSRVKKTFRGGCLCSWSLFHRRVWITWHGSLKEGKIDLTHSFKGFNLSWQGQAWRNSFMSSHVGGPGRRESKRKCSGLLYPWDTPLETHFLSLGPLISPNLQNLPKECHQVGAEFSK